MLPFTGLLEVQHCCFMNRLPKARTPPSRPRPSSQRNPCALVPLTSRMLPAALRLLRVPPLR